MIPPRGTGDNYDTTGSIGGRIILFYGMIGNWEEEKDKGDLRLRNLSSLTGLDLSASSPMLSAL